MKHCCGFYFYAGHREPRVSPRGIGSAQHVGSEETCFSLRLFLLRYLAGEVRNKACGSVHIESEW